MFHSEYEDAVALLADFCSLLQFTVFGKYNSRIVFISFTTVGTSVRHIVKDVDIDLVSPYWIRIESVKICM